MNVPQEELDRWAQTAENLSGAAMGIVYALQAENVTPQRLHAALSEAWRLQGQANRLRKHLMQAGAADPSPYADLNRERALAVPLASLSSPANRRLAELLREAATVAAQVEDERGIKGDDRVLSDTLDIYATATEQECYGPAGLADGK
ncbi:MAG TPA: hypothetical protein VKU00_01935 [Chthonomonadaceae bacterium]|nr:hypothetical protein [Chthonomonadaceae bacterium]